MSDLRQLFVHASQYLAGRAGLMLLGFLSFPVLTRILPVAQYGELSLALKLCLLWTVLSKCGIQNAALRFFPESSSRSLEEKRACSSTLILSAAGIAGFGVLLGLFILLLSPLHRWTAVAGLMPLLLILAFVRSIQPTFSSLLRSERRTWLFNTCELSGKAAGILLSIAAMLLIARDLRYYVSGLVGAEALVVFAVGIWFYRSGLLSPAGFRLRFARSALVFSLPLIAYELTSVILDSGDRLLIGRYLGLTQVGIYSAAYSVATYAEEALMTPVNMALMPAYMKVWVDRGAEATARFLTRALDLFVLGCGLIALLVYVNASDLVTVLASRKFSAGAPLLPILVLGLLIYAVHIFFNAPLIIHKRSMVLTSVTTVCCVLNILMNVLMLPRMGIAGAAWATLFSYLIMVVALAIISRKLMVVGIPLKALSCAVPLVFLVHQALSYIALPSPWLNLAVKPPLAVLLYGSGILICRPDLRARFLVRRATRAPACASFSAAEQ